MSSIRGVSIKDLIGTISIDQVVDIIILDVCDVGLVLRVGDEAESEEDSEAEEGVSGVERVFFGV